MAASWNSLFFVFKISFLPKYRINFSFNDGLLTLPLIQVVTELADITFVSGPREDIGVA